MPRTDEDKDATYHIRDQIEQQEIRTPLKSNWGYGRVTQLAQVFNPITSNIIKLANHPQP